MSALIAIVGAGRVVLAADRAAIADGPGVRELVPGVPMQLDERSKLHTNAHGVAFGVVGKSAAVRADGSVVDLLVELRPALTECSKVFAGVAAVRGVLDRHAPLFREHAGQVAAVVEPFGLAVHTVVVVAGVDSGEPAAFAIGLTDDGPIEVRTVRNPGVVYAPPAGRPHVERLLVDPTLLSAPDQILLPAVEESIALAARHALGYVSIDWEHVIVDRDGAGPVVEHLRPPKPDIGRH